MYYFLFEKINDNIQISQCDKDGNKLDEFHRQLIMVSWDWDSINEEWSNKPNGTKEIVKI